MLIGICVETCEACGDKTDLLIGHSDKHLSWTNSIKK